MKTTAKEVGLLVNEDKTKYLTLDRQHGSRIGQNITMNEFNFEVVQSFKYLGSIEAFRRGKKNLKRCEMGEKNCHVCQQKENKAQKLYCVFLFIYICLIVAPAMYLFDV